MRWHVCNLDIDGTIPAQKRLADQVETTIDLRRYEDGLRMWPDGDSLSAVRKAIDQFFADSRPKVVFYGSGDLNQLSALLLEKIASTNSAPVSVVLFDNHPDWFVLPPRYHCGNWLGTTLKQPWIESATLIGQDSEDLIGRHFWASPWSDLLSGRVRIFPYATESAFVPLKMVREQSSHMRGKPGGTEIRFESLSRMGITVLSERLRTQLRDKNVYIAIDKDVLGTEDAQTDWEQGRLTLSQLTALVSVICEASNVIGVDVCGERSPRRLRGFLKRLDAGRLFQPAVADFQRASGVNEKANLAILSAIAGVPVPHAEGMEQTCIC